jgi:hypothetical protein
MRILVCGTSVMMYGKNTSKETDQKSWVWYLQQKLNCEVVNLARAGCGNQYMHDAVIAAITEQDYDLVLVSWNKSGVAEFRCQHKLPLVDWDGLEGNPHPEYLQNDWVWSHTPDEVMPWEDAALDKKDLFKSHFRMNPKYPVNHQMSLTQILSLQSTLKSYGVPYAFVFYRKLLQLKQFKKYYEKIDWSNVHDKNLFSLAKHNKLWDNASYHPTNKAHEIYADMMYEFLSTKNLIKP